MAQNTSSAVMAQRVEPGDSFDDFPTPPWATRALMEHVLRRFIITRFLHVWEPCCNRGYMARPLAEYFARVSTSDIVDYSGEWDGQERVVDFLFPGCESPFLKANPPDWIITNPPFRLAEEFVHKALDIALVGVAVLVRTAFLEGAERYHSLFRPRPPTLVCQFVERVPMVRGRLDQAASTATAYSWLVWIKDMRPMPLLWIPPCRDQLERALDYAPLKPEPLPLFPEV